jgi:hypothetical protein
VHDAYLMNALTEIITVLAAFLLLTGPALVWLAHERRIDRRLRESGSQRSRTQRSGSQRSRTQKSSSRSTVPSTATWYADGRRSKKLVSS